MNTGQVVCGLPLYELPMPCAELVRRLGETEAAAWRLLMEAWGGVDRPRVSLPASGLALTDEHWHLLHEDGLAQVEDYGRGPEISLTDLGRKVVVAPAEARAEFVERFEAQMDDERARDAGRRERRRREHGRRKRATRR